MSQEVAFSQKMEGGKKAPKKSPQIPPGAPQPGDSPREPQIPPNTPQPGDPPKKPYDPYKLPHDLKEPQIDNSGAELKLDFSPKPTGPLGQATAAVKRMGISQEESTINNHESLLDVKLNNATAIPDNDDNNDIPDIIDE